MKSDPVVTMPLHLEQYKWGRFNLTPPFLRPSSTIYRGIPYSELLQSL